jgi:membrane protein implicated in regulation of membrane protease activity
VTDAIGVEAAITGYATAYWWGAGFFALGAVLSALLFRRRGDGLSLAQPSVRPAERTAEPVPVG